MNVAVIGLGYIGLPTAALLANGGHRVYGYDNDHAKRRAIRSGDIAAGEPSLRDEVRRAIASGHLHLVDRLPFADAYIICVPTPARGGRADLRAVEEAAAHVALVAPKGASLILESTVPPGTTERVFDIALRRAGCAIEDYHIAHCPERVIPGAIVNELRENARVIGGRTVEDALIVRDLYASFARGPIAITTTATAEFVKVIENTYRDINIAFANELAIVAEEVGIDVWHAIRLANAHPRVDILSPGPGVGGHCIPVDPYFLSEANPLVTELIQSARRVNERMPYHVVRRIASLIPADRNPRIAILGAAYKADVDDARESPCVHIDALLRERGYDTIIYDPHVRRFPQPLADSLEEALRGADALLLVTPHTSFRQIGPDFAAALMRTRTLIDTRSFFDPRGWRQHGFSCYTLGAGITSPRPLTLA